MEHSHSAEEIENPFDFLNEEDVQEHFANLNIELLRGKHIQDNLFYEYELLTIYERELKNYYDKIYQLQLCKESFDSKNYYFLTFKEDTKGALGSQRKHKELSPTETIVAITILNMYYERLFDNDKLISYEEIRYQIDKGENSDHYKRAFFKGVVQDNYSSLAWAQVFKNIKTVISDFDQLGWVQKVSTDAEKDFTFKIKESIHRFYLLYQEEINNFDSFLKTIPNAER
jgi:chromosome condensin MukBEF MukE localization factor